jgi:hypothetical protein
MLLPSKGKIRMELISMLHLEQKPKGTTHDFNQTCPVGKITSN